MGTPICSGFENGGQSGLSYERGDWQNVGHSVGIAEIATDRSNVLPRRARVCCPAHDVFVRHDRHAIGSIRRQTRCSELGAHGRKDRNRVEGCHLPSPRLPRLRHCSAWECTHTDKQYRRSSGARGPDRGEVAPCHSGDRARLLRGVAVLRCCHRCEWSLEAPLVDRSRDHLWSPLCPSGGACGRSFGEWRCFEQSRALGSQGHGLVRWDRGDRSGWRGVGRSGHRTGTLGPFSPLRQESGLGARVASVADGDQGLWWLWRVGPRVPCRPVRGLSPRRRGDVESSSGKER